MRRDMRFGKRLWAQGWEGRIDDSTEGRIRRNTKAPGGQAQPRTRLNLRRSLAFGDDHFVLRPVFDEVLKGRRLTTTTLCYVSSKSKNKFDVVELGLIKAQRHVPVSQKSQEGSLSRVAGIYVAALFHQDGDNVRIA